MARSKDCCSCWSNSAGLRREIRWLSPAWPVYLERWRYVPLSLFPQKINIKFNRENCCYRKSLYNGLVALVLTTHQVFLNTDHQTHRAQYNRWNSWRCLKRLGQQCLSRLNKAIMSLLSYEYEHRWYGYQAPLGLGDNGPFKTLLAIIFPKIIQLFRCIRNVLFDVYMQFLQLLEFVLH